MTKKFDERSVRSLDLRGMEQREELRVRKQQESNVETYRKGLNSAFVEGHRQIDLRKLAENDPAMAFFLTANGTFKSA